MTPARIAASLAPAQRRALLAMEDDHRWQAAPKGARWAMAFSPLMNTDQRWWRLTPLGREVRAIIEQEARDGR